MKKNVLIATKGIVALIPYIGGTITSVWSDIEAIQAERKLERLEEFFLNLKKDMENIKNHINENYINQPDFLDVFETTSKFIINERNEEKRLLFKNILINSIIDQNCNYDKTEKYLRLLEQMNNFEILLLKIANETNTYNESQIENETKIKSYLTEISKDDLEEAVSFLESNRLITSRKFISYDFDTHNNLYISKDKLSNKGKDFISYILK